MKHPSALWILCATEVWERYGFYVLQSLMALYISIHLGLNDADVFFTVGSFTALSYISPVIGGFISDRLLGAKKAALSGLFILSISYLLLVFTQQFSATLACLASITLGTGLLKPNLSALLGRQYVAGDNHRNSGFTLFTWA